MRTAASLGDALAQNQGRGGRGGARQEEAPSGPVVRREVRVGDKRVKVIDVHSHASIPEVADVVKGTPPSASPVVAGDGPGRPDRIRELDKRGIDIQVLDINMFWWYAGGSRSRREDC